MIQELKLSAVYISSSVAIEDKEDDDDDEYDSAVEETRAVRVFDQVLGIVTVNLLSKQYCMHLRVIQAN